VISYSRDRDNRASQYHQRMHLGIRTMSAGSMTHLREGTFNEDYSNGQDHFFRMDGVDHPVSVQYKVQMSPTFYTWTVQVSCWHMEPNFYAFYHARQNHLFLISREALHELPRSLYDGPNSNQPFFYGNLMDIVRGGGIGYDLTNGTVITHDEEDWG